MLDVQSRKLLIAIWCINLSMLIGIGDPVAGGGGVSGQDGPPRCGTNDLPATWKADQLALSWDGINFGERRGLKSVSSSLLTTNSFRLVDYKLLDGQTALETDLRFL